MAKKTKGRSRSASTGAKKAAAPAPKAAPKAAPRPAARRPQPRRSSATAGVSVSPMLVAIGVIALVGLIYLLAAGIGAGILIAAILGGALYTATRIGVVARGERGLVAAQKGVVLALVFLLPVAIDPRTADVFATVKFSVLTFGAIVLLGLFVVDRVSLPRPLRWTVLHWFVAFLVVWGIVTTLNSGHAALSALGFYSSNNGLFTLFALAVLFVVVAEVMRPSDVRPLIETLWYGATGVVVLYGALQLLDQAWPGHGLEPVNWPSGVGVKVFGTTGVWSTFGNPNHFGGYCAIALPIGLTLLLAARSWRERAASAAILVASALVITQTSSRGAWLATAVGVLLVVFLERRWVATFVRHNRVASGGAVIATGAAAALSVNSGLLSKGAGALFEFGGASTIGQRVQFWKTTLRMSAHSPVLGFGFDGYRLTWPHYLDRYFARTSDPELQVTGPHNTFFAALYWGGWPALAAFVVLIVLAATLVVRVFRGVRTSDTASVFLPAVAVMALCYLIVESFNVERLEFAGLFWVALGLIAAVARSHDVASLRLRTPADAAEVQGAVPSPARPRGPRPSRRRGTNPAPVVAGVVAVGAAVPLLWFSTAPWRADASLGGAGRASNAARAVQQANPDLAARRSQTARTRLEDASKDNPWEARYLRTRGDQLKSSASSAQQSGASAEQVDSLLADAEALYVKARALTPHDGNLGGTIAEVMLNRSSATGDTAVRDQALALLRREVRYAPYNGHLRAFYALQLSNAGKNSAAAAEIDAGLRRQPDDTNLLDAAIKIYPLVQRDADARRATTRLERLKRQSGTTTTTTATP